MYTTTVAFAHASCLQLFVKQHLIDVINGQQFARFDGQSAIWLGHMIKLCIFNDNHLGSDGKLIVKGKKEAFNAISVLNKKKWNFFSL